MKKNIIYLCGLLVFTYFISLFTFGIQTAKAEISSGITVPSFSQLQSNAKYPDPFKLMDGTRISSTEQWAKRRNEISALAQTFGYGIIPGKPQSVTGSASGNKITVSVTDNNKTISFECSIQYPSKGTAPYPAMIGCGMNTLSTTEILNLGVACITFPCDEIGAQSGLNTRGQGKFYTLYGKDHSAGSLAAWSWGVSRLIDALEKTPTAKINPTKLGVTGGSRYGKGALAIGAFEERIALTIPQESGAGGSGNFRFAEAKGSSVQRLSSTVGEQPWFSKSLDQFSNAVNKLPYDHHEILALCAPRPLLLIENPDFEWLCNEGCWNNAKCVQMVYQALGVPDRMGYSSVGGHQHCALPSSQYGDVNAFIKKFLLDDNSANTNIFKSDRNYTLNTTKWIDWTVPTLSIVTSSTKPTATPTTPIPTKMPTPTTSVSPDLNHDGMVNIADVMLLALSFHSVRGDSRFVDGYDLNRDGSINMSDVMIIALKFNAVISKTETTSVPSEKATIKVMPLGDSITDGLTVPGGYRIKLWENITRDGFDIDFLGSMSNGPTELGDKNHEGHSGWRIDQINEKINSWMDTYTPQIVLLHIGTNDVFQKYDLNNAPTRLSALIDNICNKLPSGGKLYVASIIPLSNADVKSYNAQISSIIQNKVNQGKPVYMVDMYSALTLTDLADGVHPNATGYNKMADVWYDAIKSGLSDF